MKKLTIVLGLLLVAYAVPASAVVYKFDCISNNKTTDCAIGEAQLTVDVTDAGGGKVNFKFANTGASASSITDIYFYDGTVLDAGSILSSSAGVSFGDTAVSPPNLPSLSIVGLTKFYSADSNPSAQPNGINPGEWLTLQFSLIGTLDFDDVLAAIANPTGANNEPKLIMGIHVQGFDGDGSEAFTNVVPEPGFYGALALGLAGLYMTVRRRKA